MPESTRDEFKKLARALLMRDGRAHRSGETTARTAQLGPMQLALLDDDLIATLPSHYADLIPSMRLQVCNDLDGDYDIPTMAEWIPKLKKCFVLERLADL